MLKSYTLRKSGKSGFSLAEMMVVLLIVAVVLAATAPMITRKISRERSDKIFDILNVDPTNAVEYVKGRNQRIFMNGRTNGYVGIREAGETIPKNSVLFGNNNYSVGANTLVGIGFSTSSNTGSVAVGYNVTAGNNAVAIGYNTSASSPNSTALGANAKGEATQATAIGYNASAYSPNSTAIGFGAKIETEAKGATAIGYNAVADQSNTVVLGTEKDTVYIPGNLIIGKTTMFAAKSFVDGKAYPMYALTRYGHDGDGRQVTDLMSVIEANHADDYKGGADFPMSMIKNSTPGAQIGPYLFYGRSWKGGHGDNQKICPPTTSSGDWRRISNGNCSNPSSTADELLYSDIRKKNVGQAFTAGLDELNKLSFYNFTFKNDKDKTPQVGVIAQDLQKVFPTAVRTDEKGYLLIRWDEMFYSAINAIKELNDKVIAISEKLKEFTTELTDLKAKVDKQQTEIETQAKTLNEQQQELEKLSERINKLEHKK